MRSTSLLLAASLLLGLSTLAACGDDGDGTGTPIDAGSDGTDTPIDAPMAASALGQACTGTGQGNCPTGFECLTLQNGSGSWCSKTCADMQDPSCEDGYTGPGFPACLMSVTPSGGGPPRQFCLIICEDLPGTPNICEPGECTRTCPTPLMCNADITSTTTMMVLARSCR